MGPDVLGRGCRETPVRPPSRSSLPAKRPVRTAGGRKVQEMTLTSLPYSIFSFPYSFQRNSQFRRAGNFAVRLWSCSRIRPAKSDGRIKSCEIPSIFPAMADQLAQKSESPSDATRDRLDGRDEGSAREFIEFLQQFIRLAIRFSREGSWIGDICWNCLPPHNVQHYVSAIAETGSRPQAGTAV